jgi:hypothetical protein
LELKFKIGAKIWTWNLKFAPFFKILQLIKEALLSVDQREEDILSYKNAYHDLELLIQVETKLCLLSGWVACRCS